MRKGTSINDVPHFLVIFDLPTYLVLLYNVPFLGLFCTPLPTLMRDVINGRSQIENKTVGCWLGFRALKTLYFYSKDISFATKLSWSLSITNLYSLGWPSNWSQELRVATRRDKQQRAKLGCRILLRFHSDGFVRWSIESQYIHQGNKLLKTVVFIAGKKDPGIQNFLSVFPLK